MARSTNGTTDSIDFGASSNSAGGAADLTAAVWIQSAIAADLNYHSMFSRGLGRGGGGADLFCFEAFASNDGTFPGEFTVSIGNTINNDYHVLLGPIDQLLHHQCVTYNDTSKTITGFLDGVNKGTNTLSGTRSNPATSVIIGAGHNPSGVIQEFANLALVAWASVWHNCLTQQEVTALANGACPLDIRPNSLDLFAPLGAATGALDFGPSRHNGKLNGTKIVANPAKTLWWPTQTAQRWRLGSPAPVGASPLRLNANLDGLSASGGFFANRLAA